MVVVVVVVRLFMSCVIIVLFDKIRGIVSGNVKYCCDV